MKQDTGGEDHGYDQFISRIDGIVMGRGSYEVVLKFDDWPYTKPVVVLSRTLKQGDIPERLRDKVRLWDQSPSDLMKQLEHEGWASVYVDGGKVVQSFIRAGLIVDLVLTTIPILIGDGIRLFGNLEKDIDLDLIKSNAFNSGLVQSHYHLRAKAETKTED